MFKRLISIVILLYKKVILWVLHCHPRHPESILMNFFSTQSTMYHFALKLTNNSEDAQDLVQDTFLRAFRYYDHYKPGTNSRSWLFKLMYNLFINNYRRKQKQSPN